jgi:hypothetical protein
MKVLVACEESQAVTMELRRLGHEAYSCDIQECSGGHPEWHITQDVLPLLNGDCEFVSMDGQAHKIEGKWDLIIAHPPCTYLTNAGARWLYAGGKLNEERYKKGIEAKEFFMKFLDADCEKIAVENPIPSSVYGLPPYSQIVQPYEYGHPNTKKTCFWLKGLEPLKPTDIVEPIKGRYFQQKNGNWRYSCWEMDQRGGKGRAKERSKTFPGIAKAMAEQWAGEAR